MPTEGYELMYQCDGPFKHSLDRTKYGTRYPDDSTSQHRELASAFIRQLNDQLSPNLFGDKIKLADMAILPFVRQFAHIDQAWFYAQPWPKVIAWLDAFKASDAFNAIMPKYTKWHTGDTPVYFP